MKKIAAIAMLVLLLAVPAFCETTDDVYEAGKSLHDLDEGAIPKVTSSGAVEAATQDDDYQMPHIPTFTVGTETDDNIAVVITFVDPDDDAIASNFVAKVWLSDTAGGAPTSTAPDGSGTAANGIITSDGSELIEHTAEIFYSVVTGADGDITITINDDDAANDWYVCVEIDGIVYASTVVSHAA